MSELALNVGADCSLLVSPLNVNVGPIAPEVDEEVPLELALELDAFKRLQGTATCLPDALDELEVVDEAEELLDPAPELFKERIAKSTLPELGLMTTSWIVPSVSPEEP
jgi:hypothetical protein